MIKIKVIHSMNDEDLEIDLNNLNAKRIISIENISDYEYKVIYEE